MEKEMEKEIEKEINESTSATENEKINSEVIKNELSYEESGLDQRILKAVGEMGFENMTPIQAQAIPVFMEGRDIIGQAQTGTGKTAAFGIPILQMVKAEDYGVQVLVLCPTRELAIQAAEEIRKFGKYMEEIKVLPIYGGQDISKQIRSLKGNVQIVVGTPGRVMDHMRRHTLKLDNLKMIVLDEADEMLNMGFREDIETILNDIPDEHQTGLFSATMPKPILDITRTYLKKDAELVKIAAKELTIPLVKQYYYEVKSKNKDEVTARLIDYYNPKRSLIFCNTKRKVDELAEVLKGRGYFAEGFHGDMTQAQRDKIMNGFRRGFVDILIATDVAARGIDIDDVEAVFNYDIPQDIEYYVHRIGRTGRAGKSGRSFTFAVGRDIYKIRDIERVCKTKIKPRCVPSASDVNNAKAEKVMQKAVKNIQDGDLYTMIKLVENKLDDEDFTAIELAAAFLKMQIGAEVSEMELDCSWVNSDDYKSGKRGGSSDGRRGSYRDGRRGGSSDGRRGGSSDGRGGRSHGAHGPGSYNRDSKDSSRSSYRDRDDKGSSKGGTKFDRDAFGNKVPASGHSDNGRNSQDSESDKRKSGDRKFDKKYDKKVDKKYDRKPEKKSDKKQDKKGDKKPDKKFMW